MEYIGNGVSKLNKQGKFIFWCQKVLPLVYDDSLSYYELLCKVSEKLNLSIETINKIIEYLNGVDIPTEMLEQLSVNKILNTLESGNDFRFYVSKIGSDDNDGMTPSTPMKTLDKAIKKASALYNDIRIQILSSGVYESNQLTFVGGAIHLNAAVGGVIVKYKNNAAFYGCHVNLTGKDSNNKLTVIVDSPQKYFYFDGGELSSHFVDYQCVLRFNGAFGGGADCTFRNVYIHGGSFEFAGSGNVFDNKVDHEVPAIYNELGNILTTGSITVNLTAEEVGDFIWFRGGTFDFNTSITVLGDNKYVGNADFNHGNILMPPSAYEALRNAIRGTVIIGSITTSNLHNVLSFGDKTTNVTTDSYTDLIDITIPGGSYILDVQIVVSGGADIDGVIRTTGEGVMGTKYQSVHGIAGVNTVQHIYLFSNETTDKNLKVAVQKFNGTSTRCTVNGIRL